MVGCTQSNFGIWKLVQRVGAPTMALQLLPERERPVEHMQLVLQPRAQFRQPCAPFHQRRGDQPDHEGRGSGDRDHDQHRADRAGNAVALEEARRRRQHGADHEGHHHGQEERLGEIEDGDDADDEQRHQRKGDDLGAADHRRLFARAVRQRVRLPPCWEADAHWEGHARSVLPCKGRTTSALAKPRLPQPNDCRLIRAHPRKFHRANVRLAELDRCVCATPRSGTAMAPSRLICQRITVMHISMGQHT